ncbi:hypothetical protein CRE_00131 [Caenorhabditis remanei]|uniref:Uncharacterized protein n=1 Tax=Caenorhabditis remanei TaxID=31234 RepID=E3LDB0_CAERE|nr:hypothetical protein CRE_00131 [Caenorhabditis remanei]
MNNLSTGENVNEMLTYLSLVMTHVGSNRSFAKTIKGVAKQGGCGLTGTVVGGVAAGPVGALVGGVVGSVAGYFWSSDYDGILQYYNKLDDNEKAELAREIRRTVGANLITDFYKWYEKPANQETVNNLILMAVGLAAVAVSKSA